MLQFSFLKLVVHTIMFMIMIFIIINEFLKNKNGVDMIPDHSVGAGCV